jgi:hypothetical protein
MASSFDDFWNSVIGSTALLNSDSLSQIRAAMEMIYDSTDPNAVAIISGLENGGKQLNFLTSGQYSGITVTVHLTSRWARAMGDTVRERRFPQAVSVAAISGFGAVPAPGFIRKS